MVEGPTRTGGERSGGATVPSGSTGGATTGGPVAPTRAPSQPTGTPSPTDKREVAPGIMTPPPPVPTDARTGIAPEATTTPTPPPAKETTDKKIFGLLDKVWRNILFQGVLAILCTLPGIGQVVSAVAAIISLVNIIERWITTKKPPDLVGIASTLLYIAGAFLPGVGAFGGVAGMIRLSGESKPPATEPQKVVAPKPQPQPLADEAYDKSLSTVESGLKSLGASPAAKEDVTKGEDFTNAVTALKQEHARLRAGAAQPNAKLDEKERARLERIDKILQEVQKKLPQDRLRELHLAPPAPQKMEDKGGAGSPEGVPAPA
jgi:hypothetical protein